MTDRYHTKNNCTGALSPHACPDLSGGGRIRGGIFGNDFSWFANYSNNKEKSFVVTETAEISSTLSGLGFDVSLQQWVKPRGYSHSTLSGLEFSQHDNTKIIPDMRILGLCTLEKTTKWFNTNIPLRSAGSGKDSEQGTLSGFNYQFI